MFFFYIIGPLLTKLVNKVFDSISVPSTRKKKRHQYPAISTKQAWPITHIYLSTSLNNLARVVRKVDNVIHRINPYPADSAVCFNLSTLVHWIAIYPVDSAFEQLRPDVFLFQICVPSQTVPIIVLMVMPRTNLDVKLVNVQVSVLGFREDKYFEIPGHTVKTGLKDKLLQSERIA